MYRDVLTEDMEVVCSFEGFNDGKGVQLRGGAAASTSSAAPAAKPAAAAPPAQKGEHATKHGVSQLLMREVVSYVAVC